MPHRGTGGEVTMSKVMQQSYRECGSTYVMANLVTKEVTGNVEART